MSGRLRMCMVVIMPPLTERNDCDGRIVAALIPSLKGLCTPKMANGIHAPSGVVPHEYPGQTAPEKSR